MIRKTIEIKQDLTTQEYYLDFEDIKDLFDKPEDVVYYNLDKNEDGVMVFTAFDKDKNQIFPKNGDS